MSAKAKRRTRKPPRRLSAAEIAEIHELIARRHQETEWECQEIIRREEKEQQVLLREDHTAGPWPERLKRGFTELGDGYCYVREGDKVHEVPAGHPFLREVARREGMIRYAWTGGLTFDLSQHWERDPSWQFVMTRLEGVPANDWDRVIDEAIDELLDTDIPLSQGTRQYLKEDRHARADPKRREHDRDRILALCISGQLPWLVELLRDAGFKDEKTRAAEYLAGDWRKIVRQDRGRSRFSSGPALTTWLRRHRDPTKNTLKMSCQRGRSEYSDES
jgi:hypothetical protein